jgi:hypothetical protein
MSDRLGLVPFVLDYLTEAVDHSVVPISTNCGLVLKLTVSCQQSFKNVGCIASLHSSLHNIKGVPRVLLAICSVGHATVGLSQFRGTNMVKIWTSTKLAMHML